MAPLTVSSSDLLLTFLDWPAMQLIAAPLSVGRKSRQPALRSRDTRIALQAALGSSVEMLDKQRSPVIIIYKGLL